MPQLTGLFKRGNSFYLRIVLPQGHPLLARNTCGRFVKSLGVCNHREAVRRGLLKRAEVLCGFELEQPGPGLEVAPTARPPSPLAPQPTALSPVSTLKPPPLTIRQVYNKWVSSKKTSQDTANACLRAVALFEQCLGEDVDLRSLPRAKGDEFRAWLLTKEATSKTSRDRFTWVKSLLKYATIDLEELPRNTWEGLDIAHKTTARRRPWSDEELKTLFDTPLFTRYELPKESKAGKAAAFWIPLLGLYSGARVSELAQLRVCDVSTSAGSPLISITDDGEQQHVKSLASVRIIPIHEELIRLGFLEYVEMIKKQGSTSLWPDLKFRKGKPGGYFSMWFGEYRKKIGLKEKYPDFHCFRHTVRTMMSKNGIDNKVQDLITGHSTQGSTGTRVYQHVSQSELIDAINSIKYENINSKTYSQNTSNN